MGAGAGGVNRQGGWGVSGMGAESPHGPVRPGARLRQRKVQEGLEGVWGLWGVTVWSPGCGLSHCCPAWGMQLLLHSGPSLAAGAAPPGGTRWKG